MRGFSSTDAGIGALAGLAITPAWWLVVLLRLAYLTVTNTFAVLRLLPMSDRDKDTEILAPGIRSRCWSANSVAGRCGSPRTIARSWRRCCTACPRRCCAGCGWWCVRTPCCAGIVIWSHAATLRAPGPSAREGRGPCAPSGCWCCGSPARTPTGGTAASTANSSFWALRWPPPPSGRSSRKPGSTRHPSALRAHGRTSCAPGPTPCRHATSWKRSPCPGRGFMYVR